MNETSESKTEFDSAVAVARRALKEFNREPLVQSKPGGPRLSPWWRVYVEASGVAVRWCRQMKRDDLGPSFDEGLDRMLRGLD
jgi:hypothetical protein